MDTLDILVSRLREGMAATDAEILRERAIDAWALALLRRGRVIAATGDVRHAGESAPSSPRKQRNELAKPVA